MLSRPLSVIHSVICLSSTCYHHRLGMFLICCMTLYTFFSPFFEFSFSICEHFSCTCVCAQHVYSAQGCLKTSHPLELGCWEPNQDHVKKQHVLFKHWAILLLLHSFRMSSLSYIFNKFKSIVLWVLLTFLLLAPTYGS